MCGEVDYDESDDDSWNEWQLSWAFIALNAPASLAKTTYLHDDMYYYVFNEIDAVGWKNVLVVVAAPVAVVVNGDDALWWQVMRDKILATVVLLILSLYARIDNTYEVIFLPIVTVIVFLCLETRD